jgi:hypothetical protein
MKNTMRNTLLVTVATAALIAGAGLASAQGTGENREAPGAAAHEPKAPGGKMDQHPSTLPQKSPAPNAQAPMKEKPAPTAQAPVKENPAPTAQAPMKEKPAPTAQAPTKEKPAPTAQAPTKEKPAETAQAPSVAKPQAAEHGGNAQSSEPPNSRMAPSTARDETKSGPPAALSSEQHAKIRSTLRLEKSERLTNVSFSHKVGEAIPGTVHLYVLPVSIMEYAPQYRGYEYFLVGDEILIVDPRTLRIVAVIDA